MHKIKVWWFTLMVISGLAVVIQAFYAFEEPRKEWHAFAFGVAALVGFGAGIFSTYKEHGEVIAEAFVLSFIGAFVLGIMNVSNFLIQIAALGFASTLLFTYATIQLFLSRRPHDQTHDTVKN